MKAHNFSAGPCILPEEVYQQAAQAVLNFEESGLSILEISHRSTAFIQILEEARALALDLLQLDKNQYSALFLQGSASMEFMRVPYNLLQNKAGYIDTGVWSSKALAQAQFFGESVVIGSSKAVGYTAIPKIQECTKDLDYVHFTSNNTIYGTQFQNIPETDVPLVCDMSSDIYSRKFDYNKIDLIYAGVQKNIGPAGLSLVLVKDSILGKVDRSIPDMLDYRAHIKQDNLYHTANVFGIYTSLLNLRWLLKQGGVDAIEKRNKTKATLLYGQLDSLDFVDGTATVADRSMMNVTFTFKEERLAAVFDMLCREANIVNIRGHRSVGGYRASLYNALPEESVAVLVSVLEYMKNKA